MSDKLTVRESTAEEVFAQFAKSEGEIAMEIVELDSVYADKIKRAPDKSVRMRLGSTNVWIQSAWQLQNDRDKRKGVLFEQLLKMGVDQNILFKQNPTAEDCIAMVRD